MLKRGLHWTYRYRTVGCEGIELALKDLAPIKTHQAPFQSTLAALWVLCLELIIKAPLTLCVVHTWEFSWRSTLFPISIPSHWYFPTFSLVQTNMGLRLFFLLSRILSGDEYELTSTNMNIFQRIWTYFHVLMLPSQNIVCCLHFRVNWSLRPIWLKQWQ